MEHLESSQHPQRISTVDIEEIRNKSYFEGALKGI
jgi:hypothetical protein